MLPDLSQCPADRTVADSSGINCLSKDGRKIQVGDSALFRAVNVPPFIGVIRKLTVGKEGNLKVGVNWLYRSADVILATGSPIEAAPNEIFYSFQRDEISAAALLHPCKVAFLEKGIGLPLGLSSFVCRRVYDTTNKCLWWLTDRVYTDGHQEEVDKLLDRTKHEMQLAFQTGDPSSKVLTGHTSSQQPKVTSDVTQNASLPSQGKSKKREKTDDCENPGKLERFLKLDAGDVGYLSQEHSMKLEGLANITDKDGGLMNLQCVNQLIHLMQQERNDSARKAGDATSCRTMLANVIAATEKEDCLNRFVQLGGLPVLDDWLQDAHKGKFGDAGNSKEGHANLEQLLLTLLQALDKLPIDLDALKTCIVGKSVNNLRSHKNMVIQKRARKLVDTWKKQVTAEMKMSGELKTAASTSIVWSSRQSFTEHTQAHTTKGIAASEVTLKRTASTNLAANGTCHGDSVTKSGSPASGGKMQSVYVNLKENSVKVLANSTTELPSASVKEDKNGSPGHSQNNSQSLSSGTKKGTCLILKEAGEDSSGVCTKVSSSAMHNHRVIGDGQSLSSLIGTEKEPVGVKSLHWTKSAVNEKVLNSTSVDKGSFDGTRAEALNSQRLIVRLPKLGRSPTQDLPTPTSRDSSPSLQDENTMIEGKINMPVAQQSHFPEDNNVNAVKLESGCRGDDDEGDSSAIPASCDRSRYLELKLKVEGKKDMPTGVSAPTFCNFADACEAPEIDAEEGGINLLASVAASESSEFEKFVAVELEENHNSTLAGYNSREPEKKTMQFAMADSLNLSDDKPESMVVTLQEGADEKESSVDTGVANRVLTNNCIPIECLMDRKESMGRDADHYEMSKAHQLTEEVGRGSAMESASSPEDMSLAQNIRFGPVIEVEGSGNPQDGCGAIRERVADLDGKTLDTISDRFLTGEQTEVQIHDDSSPEEGSEEGRRVATVAGTLVRMSVGDVQKAVETSGINDVNALEVAQHVAKNVNEEVELNDKPDWQDAHLSIFVKNEKRKDDIEFDGKTPCISMNETNETDKGEGAICPTVQVADAAAFLDDSQETVREKREAAEVERTAPETEEGSQALGTSGSSDRAHITLDSRLGSVADACEEGTKITFSEGNNNDIQTFVPQQTIIPSAYTAHLSEVMGLQETVALPIANDGRISDAPSKVKFDLNEGIFVEDSLQDDGTVSICCSLNSAIPHKSLSAPSSVPSGLTEPIAVVAAAAVVAMKGAFLPPSSTSQCKVEPGWRGSGATSAFRPAEARHLSEQEFSADTHTADAGVNGRQPLDIDLNVADESLLEDIGIVISESLQSSSLGMAFHNSLGSTSQATLTFPSAGSTLGRFPNKCYTSPRPELDLNQIDETEDSATPLFLDSGTGNNTRMVRDFDLNDRLSLDDAAGDGLSVQEFGVQSLGNPTFAALSRLRTSSEVVNIASCSLSGTSQPTLAVRSTTKTELPCSIAAVASATSFLKSGSVLSHCNGDLYRAGPGISSSSTAAAAAFPYAGFPFRSNFSFPSTSFATNSTSYLDSPVAATFCTVPSTEAVVSPYPSWPYLMGMPDVSGAKSFMTWSRPSLDLNAGPDPVDVDSREEAIDLRQGSALSQLPFQQVGMAERFSKRKEPEGGFDPFRQGTKQTWR